MNNSTQLPHLNLLLLGQKLHSIAITFDDIQFSHIYRDLNYDVDSLSKEVLHLSTNDLVSVEYLDGSLNTQVKESFFLQFLFYVFSAHLLM
jgi:hypothetical protein